MKPVVLTVAGSLLAAAVVLGGTDQGAKTPDHVRDKIAESAWRWVSHPTGIPTSACTGAGAPHSCCTGAGAGVCGGNPDCTGSGAPAACCTGSGTGTCLPVDCGGSECCPDPATDQECLDYAVTIGNGIQAESWRIEQQTVNDAAFTCNPYVPRGQQNGETFCRDFPATQTVVDAAVARFCSFIAASE